MAAVAVLVAACGRTAPDAAPAGGGMTTSPDSFVVAFRTTQGTFQAKLRRDWSPEGADRVHELASANHFAGGRFYRVNPRYAQFGYTGRPEVDATWIDAGLPDEPPRASNLRGTISFARGGPQTRSVILFVNRTDNTDLDALEWRGVLGFPPIGVVEGGMEVVDALFDGYGDDPMQWEDSIAALGNAFLDRRYPRLDSIISVEIVEDWR